MMDDDWKGESIIRKTPERNPHEGAGHHFKKSGLSKRVRGLSDKAPDHIYRKNMKDDPE